MCGVYQTIAEWLSKAQFAIAFTGAGISTESGIPDFRSPGSIWATSTPVLFDDFLSDPAARKEYWRQKSIADREFSAALPNVGHRVLAHWQQTGCLKGLITQNIDELHQQAGSQNILELHGSARKVTCLSCHQSWESAPFNQRFLSESRVPDCPECGGLLKHATISFGQQLTPSVLMKATQWSRQSDLCLAIGSSLVVEPAASIPRVAAERGVRLVIVNREATPLDHLAAHVLREPIGTALQSIDEKLQQILTSRR